MPTATSEKLNQLRQQLQDCTNPKVAKLLKSAIAKLEAQLNSEHTQTKSSKVAQRKAAIRKFQKEGNRKAAQQQRTILKPPSLKKEEPQAEAQTQKEQPAQDNSQEQAEAQTPEESQAKSEPENPQTQTELKLSKKRFPPQAIKLARRLKLPKKLWQRPEVAGITIDGPDSRDLDDAIWIEPIETGAKLSVHIADVSELVKIDSLLDQVVMFRTTTRYYGNGNVPMIPRPLSEDKLSLLEGQKRPTLTVQITLDPNAQITDLKIFESWIASKKRYSYAIASDTDSPSDFQDTLEMSYQWAVHLYQNRLRAGAIGATQTSKGQWLTEEGSLIRGECHRSHLIIQEFMILANRAVAQWLADQDIPALYRNHTARAIAPDRETINQTLMLLGSGSAVHQRLHCWLNRAEYSPVLIGHFALNLPAYCHFTSPIRRVADLINHRIVKALLKQQDLPYTQSDLAELGQHISKVRREEEAETTEYFKAVHQQIYQEQIEAPEKLDSLSISEFTNLLKYVVKNEDIEPLRDELITRLASERLAVQDLYLMLFRSGDSDLQQRVIVYLKNNIQDAPSIIAIAVNQEKGWEDFEYDVVKRASFNVWLGVKISGESFTTVHPAVHPRKQTSRHTACLRWLEAYLENRLVPPEEKVVPSRHDYQQKGSEKEDTSEKAAPLPKTINKALMSPLKDGQDCISMLINACQTLKWESPQFKIDESEAWFICECELSFQDQRIEGSGVAKRKKLAKNIAAREVLEKVRELVPEHLDTWLAEA